MYIAKQYSQLWFTRRAYATTLAAAIVVVMTTTSLARADLHFDQPLAEAGEVRAGAPLVHRFTFVNDGKEPAEITETRVSCGCLKAGVEKANIPVGGRGEVTLEVNTLAASAGQHNWYLYVTYHCGKTTYEMSLRLSGEVVTEVSVEPAAVTVFAGSAVGHEIILTDLREHPLTISSLQASSPKLHTHIVQASTDAQGHQVQKIELEVAPDYPEGRHEEMVDIYTDDPSYRDLRVPVTVVKRSPQRISATPSQVDFVAAPGQEVPSRVLYLRSGGNQDVLVDRIETEDPAIVCQWARGPGAMTTVRVNIDRRRMQGTSLQSSIRIHVNQPNDATVVVPITCVLE
jgi:hypothetical protein